MCLIIDSTATGEATSREGQIIARYNRMTNDRSNWETTWQQLRALVRPSVPDFTSGLTTKGKRNSDHIYDGTAIWGLEQLASGMHSFLTNPSDQWFMINIRGRQRENLPLEVARWLHEVEDIIFNEYARPKSAFTSSVHEAYLDIGCFGTCSMYQYYSQATGGLRFRTYPLSDVWVQENNDGIIDVHFRRMHMSWRQIVQEWPKAMDRAPKAFKHIGLDETKTVTVVHAVMPRTDRMPGSPLNTQMPFASFYVILETQEMLSESGYPMMPYHVGRWSKLAGETYGRSPGSVALPDIRMVNQLSKTLIMAAQKMTDPPVVLDNDSYVHPIKTAPGSLIYREPGSNEPTPSPMHGQPEIGIEVLNQHREQILRAFYVEWVVRDRKRERQTAFEVQDERAEMLQMLSPIMGRMQSELLGPIIRRSYRLLYDAGRIPEPPFQDEELVVEYSSPASRAQLGSKAMAAKRYVQDLMGMAQVDPSVLMAVDMQKFAKMIGRFEDIPPEIMRSDREIKQLMQAQEAQQQQMMEAETTAQGAKATRDIAEARAKDPSMAL